MQLARGVPRIECQAVLNTLDAAGSATSACAQPVLESGARKRSQRLFLAIASYFLSVLLPGFSVAEYNSVGPPISLSTRIRNAIVRVGAEGGQVGGTGTVIHVKTAPNGWWLCVLTADHVVAHRSNWAVGFGNGSIPNGTGSYEFGASVMFRGPQLPNGAWVDLAMLGVFVADINGNGEMDEIPEMTPIPVGDPNDLAYYVVVAGYGQRGDVNERSYTIINEYGIFVYGVNFWENPNGEHGEVYDGNTGKLYQYLALRADLDFYPDQPPIRIGDAHILPGDSGGPSLQGLYNGQEWEWYVTGVHSASQFDRERNRVLEGSSWWDVHTWAYRNWIAQSCEAVPEPSSVGVLLLGALGLIAYRCRGHFPS